MGKTAVVGVLRGSGTSDMAIGLRADMDGLPMDEANDFAHKSLTQGRMHACGHDGHMAMLLGAAKYLSSTKNFDGTVYFIFQPAEEGGAGAKAMMDDGLFTDFNMANVWGMHNWPGLAAGKIAVHDGACMASADHFKIEVHGRGGMRLCHINLKTRLSLAPLWCRICKPLWRAALTLLMPLLSQSRQSMAAVPIMLSLILLRYAAQRAH